MLDKKFPFIEFVEKSEMGRKYNRKKHDTFERHREHNDWMQLCFCMVK